MTRSERRSGRPWSVPLALGDVPEAGRHIDLVADTKTRAAVAEHAGLAALPRLEASFDVAPHALPAEAFVAPRIAFSQNRCLPHGKVYWHIPMQRIVRTGLVRQDVGRDNSLYCRPDLCRHA